MMISNEKQKEIEEMKSLENWSNPIKGVYRYVIGANFCYEIIVLCHCLGTDILTAKSTAYASGEWSDPVNGEVYDREEILANHPIGDCLESCVEDYIKNCK